MKLRKALDKLMVVGACTLLTAVLVSSNLNAEEKSKKSSQKKSSKTTKKSTKKRSKMTVLKGTVKMVTLKSKSGKDLKLYAIETEKGTALFPKSYKDVKEHLDQKVDCYCRLSSKKVSGYKYMTSVVSISGSDKKQEEAKKVEKVEE